MNDIDLTIESVSPALLSLALKRDFRKPRRALRWSDREVHLVQAPRDLLQSNADSSGQCEVENALVPASKKCPDWNQSIIDRRKW